LGCPGHPSWDLPDIQSTSVCRMSQDCPRTSLMGSSRYPVNLSLQDVPGLSQDVPHGIFQISSQPQLAGYPRNVLECHPRTLVGLSKDVRTLVGNTGHECTLHIESTDSMISKTHNHFCSAPGC